jgi:hypothetical protein
LQADGAQVAPLVAAASVPSPSSAPVSRLAAYRRIVASLQARIASCAVVALRSLSPPLTSLLRFTIVLQAAAAARIAGKDEIFEGQCRGA